MIRLKMKNRNTTLAKKIQKNQNYHQVKLVNIKILHAKNLSFRKNFWETTKTKWRIKEKIN